MKYIIFGLVWLCWACTTQPLSTTLNKLGNDYPAKNTFSHNIATLNQELLTTVSTEIQAKIWYQKAKQYALMKQIDSTLFCCQKSNSLINNNIDVNYILAIIYTKQQKKDSAFYYYTRLIEMDTSQKGQQKYFHAIFLKLPITDSLTLLPYAKRIVADTSRSLHDGVLYKAHDFLKTYYYLQNNTLVANWHGRQALRYLQRIRKSACAK
jgi:tetratricopeptide (TPR) repeat protein